MQMWRNFWKCQEWQSRLTTYKRYCFTNGMTSALSLGNGGGTHLVCCAPVSLLTKSAILVKASEFFLLCSPTFFTVSSHWCTNPGQCFLCKSARAMHLASTSSYLSVKVWKYSCCVISPLAFAASSSSANFLYRASNSSLTSFAAALPTASFNEDVSLAVGLARESILPERLLIA